MGIKFCMRIRMKKGKQRKMLAKEKSKLDLTWKQFADNLDIKFSKLKSFYYEESLIDSDTLDKVYFKDYYKKFILERLEDNWGRKKGGKNSSGNLKEINIPDFSFELAELWGILLGDGHIERTKGYKLGVYHVQVSGHSIDDKTYLLNYVKPLMEKLFNIKVRSYFSKFNKGLYLFADSRKMVDFFEENGFKAGNKIINQVTIPNWIKNNKKILAACLRGLFDTDGSFYKLTNQNSYQINFKNHNFKLLKDVRGSLLNLGIGVSNIMKNNSIVITKKSEIAKFYKLIGFSNLKHLNKIKKLIEAP
jgi:intein/homing endonuclease